MGDDKDAIDQYDKVLDINPDEYSKLNNKGQSLSDLGNYSEAIKVYDRANLIDPENYITHNNKGYALFKLGKIDEAIKSTTKSIMHNHDFSEAWYNLAIYDLEKNRTDESLSNLRNALMLDQNYLNRLIDDKDIDKIRNNTNFIKLVEEFKSGI